MDWSVESEKLTLQSLHSVFDPYSLVLRIIQISICRCQRLNVTLTEDRYIIELEAEVVDSEHTSSGNVLVQQPTPGPQPGSSCKLYGL